LDITSNPSVKNVQNASSKVWGQVMHFEKPKSTVRRPNVTYQFELKTKLAVPVIEAETKTSLARQEGSDEVKVSIIVVDWMDHYDQAKRWQT
jgi:hypothetical protein